MGTSSNRWTALYVFRLFGEKGRVRNRRTLTHFRPSRGGATFVVGVFIVEKPQAMTAGTNYSRLPLTLVNSMGLIECARTSILNMTVTHGILFNWNLM
jgi:hypothetical protein